MRVSGDVMEAEDCGSWRLLGSIYHVSPIDHIGTWRKPFPLTRPWIETVPPGPVTFTAYPSEVEKREIGVISRQFHVSGVANVYYTRFIFNWGLGTFIVPWIEK